MVAPNLPRRRALAAVLGLAAVSALAAGCTGTAAASNSANTGAVSVNAAIAEFPAASRQPAPALSGTTVDGKAYTTSYTGHVTVINIWGAWCTACREEAASFAESYLTYKSKGVQFLGIDTMEPSNASAVSYESQFGIEYPSLQDPQESLLLSLRSFITSEDVPSTLILDSSGKVAVRALGAITEPELDQELNYVLTGSGS
jgi:thiol-disulfide isomerase/thioredoxin